MADPLPVLWHFRLSHYNEKARWALDWKRLPHRRQALLPGPHLPRVWWLTGQTKVPVLQIDGETVADSTRIIGALERRHPAPPLYPDDPAARARALALEDFFDEDLGPHVRRVGFHHLLPNTEKAIATLTVGESSTTRLLYGAVFPAVRTVMKRNLEIDAAHTEESRAKVTAALERVEAELDGRWYLVGDRFTVADLTAAALLAPLLRPPEFPYPLPPLEPSLADWRAALVDRPAFRWAAEMYRRHRGTSAEVSH